jgi:hypothetical protein
MIGNNELLSGKASELSDSQSGVIQIPKRNSLIKDFYSQLLPLACREAQGSRHTWGVLLNVQILP